jgi:hypothetical protein
VLQKFPVYFGNPAIPFDRFNGAEDLLMRPTLWLKLGLDSSFRDLSFSGFVDAKRGLEMELNCAADQSSRPVSLRPCAIRGVEENSKCKSIRDVSDRKNSLLLTAGGGGRRR